MPVRNYYKNSIWTEIPVLIYLAYANVELVRILLVLICLAKIATLTTRGYGKIVAEMINTTLAIVSCMALSDLDTLTTVYLAGFIYIYLFLIPSKYIYYYAKICINMYKNYRNYKRNDNIRVINANTTQDCPVCLIEITNQEVVGQLRCNHIFHVGCIRPWLDINSSCPVCRMLI